MVAQATFEIANSTVAYLKQRHPAAFRTLVNKIGIETELAAIAEAATLLYVPQPDKDTGVIEQFDSYFKLKDASIKELKANRIHPNEYFGAGQGLAVPTKIIKQADVVMMLNLFRDRYSKEIKRANWEYYEPRTEHSSSLSACAYAMLAADIGKLDWAYNYFLKTAKMDLEAKYKIYVGTVFIGGSHPAANGGAWMAAVFGFGGVKAGKDQIVVNPQLYEKWKSLEFKINYKGRKFTINITKDAIAIAADKCNKGDQSFLVYEKAVGCAPGTLSTIVYRLSQ
jgi:kojibiose phosphorylase